MCYLYYYKLFWGAVSLFPVSVKYPNFLKLVDLVVLRAKVKFELPIFNLLLEALLTGVMTLAI